MRITVIGAGVFGAWSARSLADDGHAVTLVDAYGAANGRASSSDHSRVIRAGYGADEIYTRMVDESRRDWRWLSEATGRTLLVESGALFMGEPGNTYIQSTYDTLTRLKLAAEWLDPAQLRTRFPQIATEHLGDALWEPHAGVLRARAAVQALVGRLVTEQRVRYVVARVRPIDEQAPSLVVSADSAADIAADAYVFACGPWLPAVFPVTVGARIRPTRQEVLYFGVPAGQTRFSTPHLPVWIDFAAGYYGIPDLDVHGFKVGVDRHGPAIDPDTADRVVEPAVIARTRAWMASRFPGMRDAPLVEGRVCQYENTSTGDFLIDHHPVWPHCWIVGGGSGHGFKHGPAVGRQVAALVAGTASVQPRFALSAKAIAAARAVY